MAKSVAGFLSTLFGVVGLRQDEAREYHRLWVRADSRLDDLDGMARDCTLVCTNCDDAFGGEPEALLGMVLHGCPLCCGELRTALADGEGGK